MDIRGRNAVKSSLLALAVAATGLLGSVQSASAQNSTPFNFNPTGGAGATYTIQGLSFAPGNALAVGTGGAALKVGDTFQVYFQTHLNTNGFTGPGAPQFVPGLNGTPGANPFQITEVATLTETVTSLTTTGSGANQTQTATFTLVPNAGNRINIYQAPGVSYNDAAGTGFTNGTVIASLTPTSFTGSNFTNSTTAPPFPLFNTTGAGNGPPPTQSIAGSGSTGIRNTVTSYSPAFFQPPSGNPQLTSSLFNSNLSTPFDAISPSLLFTNPLSSATFAPNIGAINGVTGPDVQFQVAGFTQSFSAVVPEPASVTLMGLGIVGALVVVGRKRAQTA